MVQPASRIISAIGFLQFELRFFAKELVFGFLFGFDPSFAANGGSRNDEKRASKHLDIWMQIFVQFPCYLAGNFRLGRLVGQLVIATALGATATEGCKQE